VAVSPDVGSFIDHRSDCRDVLQCSVVLNVASSAASVTDRRRPEYDHSGGHTSPDRHHAIATARSTVRPRRSALAELRTTDRVLTPLAFDISR